MKEKISLEGYFEIEIINEKTLEVVKKINVKNALMNINKTIRNEMLMGTYSGGLNDLEIKYFAFGTGIDPITKDDTKLSNEVYRKQITQKTQMINGNIKTLVSLSALECNTQIKEIGVFSGPSSSITKDSGLLISRILVNINKNSNITLNISRQDVCTI